ncbi:MAG: YggS family pyridoxal phosphate-dependent enzyme [Fibrobacterota bacterium]
MDYSYVENRLTAVEEEISAACRDAGRSRDEITLIAVTKTKPVEAAQAVLAHGCIHLGENRPQEIMEKAPALKTPHTMHLIGQLQSNKVRKVAPFVDWVHSVDREKILNRLDDAARELNKTINICLQINTTQESAKSGCPPQEARTLCEAALPKKHLVLRGLMTMGPLGGTEAETRTSFAALRKLGGELKDFFPDKKAELSMGMSGDFPLAIAEGATMVRIGSKIVGMR